MRKYSVVLLLVVCLVLSLGAVLILRAPHLSAQDSNSIQVGVVVQGADGNPQTFCVSLADGATGAEALEATGLEIVIASGSMGATVCRIEADGCTPPGDSCFCQCEGGSSCTYWSYFHRGPEGNWQYSPVGAGNYTLKSGDVEGWWWRTSSDAEGKPLSAVSFDDLCSPGFPRTVVDGMGREVPIDAPPQRIASVTLGSDEILQSLVGPERLLGVTFFASDPAISNIADQLEGIPHTDLVANTEYLISLDPDLVIVASFTDPAALDQLLDADLTVLVLTEFNTVDEIRTNIRLLGQVTGEETRAETLIAAMDSRLNELHSLTENQDPLRVLYYEPGGITYGPGSTVDEIITLAGGENVIAESDLGAYPLVDAEYIIAANPDVVLLGGWFTDSGDPLTWFLNDPAFRTLRAVQNRRVYAVNDAHMTNVSQYVVLGVEDVARALYPELFEQEGS